VQILFATAQESEIADRAIRSDLLSMERLLVHTIYVRTRSRLTELKQELQSMLKDVECKCHFLTYF
jgi:mediator of RNA polymerase II transcription subunit 14